MTFYLFNEFDVLLTTVDAENINDAADWAEDANAAQKNPVKYIARVSTRTETGVLQTVYLRRDPSIL